MNMTRRSFLSALAACTAALGLPVAVAQAEPARKGYTQAPGIVTRTAMVTSGFSHAVADTPLSEWLEPYVRMTWTPGVVTRIGSQSGDFRQNSPRRRSLHESGG